ncbi:MAG TPA: hypothetical protein VK992_00585, partial [Candidatus Caenarcaniphilales bacterium]|nr:hypothetical protein [Candidatus Caenarcaniphilales bacterium]
YTDVLTEETLFKRPEAGIRRPAYDPFARRQRTVRAIYGHRKGKSAVRLSVDTLPKTPHRFVGRDDAPLPTVTTGYLLHYYAHSFDAFVHKFRRFHDHPDTHQWGNPLKPQKQLLRDVVNRAGLSDDELRDYYRRWVIFDEQEIRRLSRRRRMGVIPQQPAIVEVTSVRRALEQIRAAADAVAGATSGNDAAGSR